MYKDIEFVCSGNNGRSPVAEAVGVAMIKERGLDGQFKVSSSGTMVDVSRLGNLGDVLAPYVTDAITKGLLTSDRAERLQENPQEVLDELVAIEEGWRNRYIAENLGFDYSPHMRQQTIVSPRRRLVLPVDENNLKRVRTIYGSGQSEVAIELLPRFAGVDIGLDQTEFGKNYEDYEELASRVEKVTRVAMSRILDF